MVFTYQGDGDLAAIGTGETIHACNRGDNITIIYINNAIYGMTGGQMAPTTLLNMRTATTPEGRKPELHGYPFKISDIRHTTDVSPNQTVDSAIDPPTAQILEISDIPIELPMTEIQIAPLEATLKPAILLSNGVPKEKPSDTEPDEPAVKEILPDLNKPALYLHATAVSEDHREDSNAELRKRTVPVEVLFPKPNPEIERKQEPVDTLFEAKIEILIFVASNEKKWEEETRKLPTLRLKR